jgi:hypothetical protein
MLARLEEGPAGAAAGDKQLAMRKKMAEELVIEESKHEAMEEMYFWPAVRDKLPGGDTLADQATGQEQEAKKVLDRLGKLDAGEPEFERLLGEFLIAGREHMEFEETRVWPGMRQALTAQEASELGTKIQEGKKTAPTRPHPATPPQPAVLKSAGPMVAALDRARDAATGRGQAKSTAAKPATGRPHTRNTRGGKTATSVSRRADAKGKTRAELYEEARELDVAGRSSMNKAQLARQVAKARKRAGKS